MNWFVLAALVCVLVPSIRCADSSVEWCYHESTCNPSTWSTISAPYCNGTRQSPINIVSASATEDASLVGFTFTNYGSTTALQKIENTGRTVKVTLASGVQISGGNLSENYDSLQFHLHWGNLSTVPGSEHTVNGKQYAMELHIVNAKSSFNGNTTLAVADSEGLAALGFFIEAQDEMSQPFAWANLTSYLSQIKLKGSSATITPGLSLNDLIGSVDTTKYYRYLGSLTTPKCNEAVVWTVFKDTIKVSKNLIDLFSTSLSISNSTMTPLMVNVFRPVQGPQPVFTQPGSGGITTTTTTTTTSPTTTDGTSTVCYSLGLMALSLVLGRC